MMALIALAGPITCAWFALSRLSYVPLIRAGVAIAIGISVPALTTIVILALTSRIDWRFFVIDAVLWTCALAVSFRRCARYPYWAATPCAPPTPARWVLLLAVALCVVALVRSSAALHGAWDAWAIWNLRARFLFRARDWTHAFLPELAWSHPDYPLLLPVTVGRLWAWQGVETPWIPFLISPLFAAATLFLVVGMAALINPPARVIAGCLLIGSPWVWEVPKQLADVPAGLYFATCFALATVGWRKRDDALVAVAGGTASMAAWTKNEGMLFALVFAIACVVMGKRVLPWIFGALPGFVMLAWFKLTLAPSSDLAQPIAVIVGNLVDASRHAAVVHALPGAAGWWWTPPLVLLTYQVTGTWRNPDTRIALALIALMLAGYYLVYVTSPHAQAWHVETSFARLLVHLWPIGILAGTCVANDSKQRSAADTIGVTGAQSNKLKL